MPNLQKPAEFGKTALTIAAALMTPGSPATIAAVAGESAGLLIGLMNWDKNSNNRISVAVRSALKQTKKGMATSAQRILDELIVFADSPVGLDKQIQKTDSYLIHFCTPKTWREIADKFQSCFIEEMRKYPDLLLLLNGMSNGISKLNTLEKRTMNNEVSLAEVKQMLKALKNDFELQMREPKLCLPGMTPGVQLIGRDDDLTQFTREAASQEKICIVSGIGGVGKTEFIKAYLKQNRDVLKHIGWFDYRGGFRETLLTAEGLVFPSLAPDDDQQARYNEIMRLLRQLETDDLLVFDNVNGEALDEKMADILSLPCRVIFTTRYTFNEERNRLFVYDMTFLSEEACMELFSHYRRKKTLPEEHEALCEVIRLAGRHTMALELMAKTCKAAGLTINGLLERLNRDGFNLDGIQEEVRCKGGHKSKRFLEHMLKLYDIADIKALGPEAEQLLANLSVLPLQDFSIDTLISWLQLPDRVLLNRLDDRGWIRIGDEDTVTMHAVIAEVIRAALKPDANDCETLLESVQESIMYEEADVGIYQAPYSFCAESVLRYMAGETERRAKLFLQVGFVQNRQGDYTSAFRNFLCALKICEKVLGTEHPDTATTYNNIAGVYYSQGDYPKAIEWYGKALSIREQVLGTEHPDTATTYNNIAGVYYSQGDYPKALEWYGKALEIHEKVLGLEHPDTATTYNNIAGVYYSQGDYPKALEWYGKDLAICEQVLGKEHPDTATTYNNIAGGGCMPDRGITRRRWNGTGRLWRFVSKCWGQSILIPLQLTTTSRGCMIARGITRKRWSGTGRIWRSVSKCWGKSILIPPQPTTTSRGCMPDRGITRRRWNGTGRLWRFVSKCWGQSILIPLQLTTTSRGCMIARGITRKRWSGT